MRKSLIAFLTLFLFSACSLWPVKEVEVEEITEPTPEPVEVTETVEEAEPEPEPEPQKNVEDYFYEIPDKYFLGPLTREEREQAITTLDPDNYYLEFQPRTWDGGGSFTIFIAPGDQYVFAFESKGCGPICEQQLYFLEHSIDGFTDVTDQYLPADLNLPPASMDPEFAPLFILPQEGTTIKVINQYTQEQIAEIKWRKGEFILNQFDNAPVF